jgi:hypothetical protein
MATSITVFITYVTLRRKSNTQDSQIFHFIQRGHKLPNSSQTFCNNNFASFLKIPQLQFSLLILTPPRTNQRSHLVCTTGAN